MKNKAENLWQTREFAEKARITARTLHHYDRLGLLKSQHRTAKGFLLYGEAEFARLQQILTLKFIGFSLAQIKKILGEQSFALPETLTLQRRVIEAQRHRLNLALEAINRAEKVFTQSGSIDWESFQKIIEVIDMQDKYGLDAQILHGIGAGAGRRTQKTVVARIAGKSIKGLEFISDALRY